ncbi:MAG TPA: hypothetical protein VLW85_18530 [Myxococcales bacterium]|nr:hypothetical protein [Myxococcales bacterium]
MLVIAVLLSAAAAPPKVAAVLELRNKLEGPDRNLVDAAFLTDVVRQQVLEGAPAVKLMTRENVLTLLEASGRKLEECEGECEVETGRRLGADVIVTGEILRFGRGFRANLRLHDTHSAQLLSAAVASGDTPEALEKDLARAVGKLVVPLQSGYEPEAKSAEWFETIGVYLAFDIGPLSVENDTPRSVGPPAGTLTLTNAKNNGAQLAAGVQYHPWPWLIFDAAYTFIGMTARVDSAAGDGHTDTPQTFTAPALSFGATGLWRVRSWFRLFGGLGAAWVMARISPDNASLDSTNSLHFANAGGTGTYDQSASFTRFFLRGGIELKPQDRFGIQLSATVYPVPHELDVYVNNVQGGATLDQPVLKYTMPVITGNAAVVLYF